jgi:hypothetical protein
MKNLIVTLLILSLSAATLIAQVSDINKNVEKDKSNNTSTNSDDYDSFSNNGDGFAGFIGSIFINTIGAGQMAALKNKDLYPERISLETFGSFGTEITSSANYFETGIRGNWGIFATDFRYSKLNDFTGDLKSLDWLVLVFRIPIKNFKIDYGLGFISLIDLDKSYFKSSIGFDWMFHYIGLNINSVYQWTERTSLETRYKRNFDFSVDFNAFSFQRLHISPMVKYSYQNYFGESEFSIFSVGAVVRLL